MTAVLERPRPTAWDIRWEYLPDDFVLPDDPVENQRQPLLASALIDALGSANYLESQMLVASNFALCATVTDKTVVTIPGYHIGDQLQQEAVDQGYGVEEDQALISSMVFVTVTAA